MRPFEVRLSVHVIGFPLCLCLLCFCLFSYGQISYWQISWLAASSLCGALPCGRVSRAVALLLKGGGGGTFATTRVVLDLCFAASYVFKRPLTCPRAL